MWVVHALTMRRARCTSRRLQATDADCGAAQYCKYKCYLLLAAAAAAELTEEGATDGCVCAAAIFSRVTSTSLKCALLLQA
uniref:Uncharacterized protein n=1 Tax=Leersia perrieri TaxID=77586 RepID=A0A0D9VUN5_9ORYZ